jgi:hypothetical protein
VDVFVWASRASSIAWMVFAILTWIFLVSFARAVRGNAAGGPARAALSLAAGVAVLHFLQLAPDLGLPGVLPDSGVGGRAVQAVNVLVPLAFDIAFFFAIARSRAEVPRWLGPAYFAARLTAFAIALPPVVLDYDAYRALMTGDLGAVVRWVRFPVGLGYQVLTLVLLRGLVASGAAVPVGIPGEPTTTPAGRTAQQDIWVGAAWLVGGLLVTVWSYAATSGGGRYVIAYGAVVYGAIRLLRGLAKL